MRIKALFVVGLFVMGLMFMAPQKAEADTWVFCSLDEVGGTTALSGAYGVFTHLAVSPVFDGQQLYFVESRAKEMLATALTAFSMGLDVWIRVRTDGVTIDRIRVVK